jgi:hypothetical protein
MELKLFRVSLILAPLLYAVSGFFWINGGQYSVTCGVFIITGSFFWIFAFEGLFDLFRDKSQAYTVWGKVIAIYGCACGGICFGLQGMFAEMFNISHTAMLQALARYPVASNLLFWAAGPAFPLSILVLGIMLWVKRLVPWWCGILFALGGLLFPVSRILRIENIAHLVDLLMLIPAWYIAIIMFARHNRRMYYSNL